MLGYLIEATFYGALGFPLGPVTWSCLVTALVLQLSKPLPFRWNDLLLLLPFLITASIIAYGTLFHHQNGIADSARTTPIIALLGCQIILAGVLVWVNCETRGATIFFMIFAFCFSLPAAFEASMSVTNAWL